MTDIALSANAVPAAVAIGKPKTPFAEACQEAFVRALRTFLQAFLAVWLAGPALHLNVGVLKAAGTAGLTAVLTLAHRALDETSYAGLKTA